MPVNRPVIRGVIRSVITSVIRTALPIPILDMPLNEDLTLRRGVGVATLTRSSIGKFINKTDGFINDAAINVARFETNGILIEGGITNLFLRTEEIDNAYWTKFRLTVSANAEDSPGGPPPRADTIVDTATTGSHDFRVNVTPVAGQATLSIFCQAGTIDIAKIFMGIGSTASFFKLASGTLGTIAAGHEAAITPFNNSFFRCSITTTVTASSLLQLIGMTTVDGNADYVGDGTGDLTFWGAQIENLNFPTSVTHNTSAAVPRGPDSLSIDVANIPAPTADYTVSVEVDILGIDSSITQTIYSVDGETSRKIEVNGTTGLIEATHGAVTSTSTTALVAGTKTKIAFVVDGTNQTLYINGIQEDQDIKGTVTGTATAISIGNAAGINQLFGHEKSFRIDKVALTANQVLALPE